MRLSALPISSHLISSLYNVKQATQSYTERRDKERKKESHALEKYKANRVTPYYIICPLFPQNKKKKLKTKIKTQKQKKKRILGICAPLSEQNLARERGKS